MPVKGRCHCGAIQFELSEMPSELTNCNCSFCVRRGGLVAYYRPEQFKLLTAPDRVWTYQWGDYVCQHHYCPVCGMGTHSTLPSFDSGQLNFEKMRVAVNARLLEDLGWEKLPVKHVNGRQDW
jgi:hypothetical protein